MHCFTFHVLTNDIFPLTVIHYNFLYFSWQFLVPVNAELLPLNHVAVPTLRQHLEGNSVNSKNR